MTAEDRAQQTKEHNIAQFKDKAATYDNETTTLVARVVAERMLGFEFPHTAQEEHSHSQETVVRDCDQDEASNDNIDVERRIVDDDGVAVNTKYWNPESTRVLDFACGTGLLSQHLAPYAKQIVGVDISQEMVDIYNGKVYNQGIPESEMHASVVDVTEDTHETTTNSDLSDFDAIVTSLAYHHIYDVDKATAKLANLLKKGGRLYVADIGQGSGSVHGNMADEDALKDGVAHKGGVPTDLLVKTFEDAGLVNVTATNCVKVKVWAPEPMVKNGFSGLTGETKEVKGRKLYRARMNLVLVVGQKP